MNARSKNWLGVFVAGALAVAVGACGGGGSSSQASGGTTSTAGGSESSVVLSASATQPSFHRNQPVGLRVTVANHGTQSVSVSTFVMGTLHVVSLTRDGHPVAPRQSFVEPIEDLGTVIHGNLRALNVGASLALDWGSQFNQSVGGQALYSVSVEQPKDAVALYSVATPGHYVVSLDYSYPSTAKPEPSAFQGPTNQASASFDVVT